MLPTPPPLSSPTSHQPLANPGLFPDYVLVIGLRGTRFPTISRVLTIPASYTFHQLHLVIQAAFSLQDEHMYSFHVFELPSIISQNNAAQHGPRDEKLRIQKKNPLGDFTYTFLNPGREISPPTPFKPSEHTRLPVVFEDYNMMMTCSMEYKYDNLDQWQFNVALFGRSVTSCDTALCIAGEGHGPAERVGGVDSWAALKRAYAASVPTQQQRRRMMWFEVNCSNGSRAGMYNGGWWLWNKENVNERLRLVPEYIPRCV